MSADRRSQLLQNAFIGAPASGTPVSGDGRRRENQAISDWTNELAERSESGSYWDGYYRLGSAPELPSQFALFVANELATGVLPRFAGIIDLGCGNGRDSMFLAGQGHRIAGLDRSAAAIESCRKRLDEADPVCQARATFAVGSADETGLADLAASFDGPVLIYSRFFFHAIDDDAESAVLERVGMILRAKGGMLATEYRTLEDQCGTRETTAHYRRYIDPARFLERLEAFGLGLVWSAQGRGMAKYRDDDAHIARMIAKPW